MNLYNIYLIIIIINIGILSVAMYYTFSRLEARGARQLFLFLFVMLSFISLFFASLIVRTPQGKENMLIPGYGFLLTLPIIWTLLVYEISNSDMSKSWHFTLPFGILNFAGFILFFVDIPKVGEMIYYHTCQLNGPLFSCEVDNSFLFEVVIGMLLVEMFGGVIYLLYNYFVSKKDEQRARYLLLILAVGVGTLGMALAGTVFNDISVVFDPIPFVMLIWSGLMVFAVFSRRLLRINFGGFGQNNLRDDLLLVVDNDHYIQDVNMSTLQVFGVEVQNVVSAQLETVFADFPELINLFNLGNTTKETIELQVDDEIYQFRPMITTVLDPDTRTPLGLQLQLRDITGRQADDEEVQGTVAIIRDPLTNQYNRESFFQFGRKLLNHTRERQQPIAVVVVDIDDFQSVNQRFSHLVGDQGLIQLVSIINNIIRSTDLQARFKEDEMVLLLPNVDEFTTFQICSRIKDTVAGHRFSFQSQEFQMTVSLGYTIAERGDECDLEEIVNVAYQALEQSHSLGRSRLTFLPISNSEAL
jgi:diguanylate cyclase (GGDEF)-like protein